jgi:DNA-binding beta-propeller fold protein YncE
MATAEPVTLSFGASSYEWVDAWARLPDTDSARRGWAHTEVVFTPDGELLTGHPGEPTVLVLDPEGNLVRSFDVPVTEVHGMTLAGDLLWIADIGSKRAPSRNYENVRSRDGGQVIAVDLHGRVVERLPKPSHPAYAAGAYAPTVAAVDIAGDAIWVADGYGESYVHRFDFAGHYEGTLSGEEQGAAGRFKTPHYVYIDTRRGDREIYIADRANRRIQVYDADGRFRRAFGEDFMTGPTDLTPNGDHLLVVEYIDARVTVLDAADRPIGFLGENKGAYDRDDWPNSVLADGTIVRNDHLVPGKLTAPHSVAVDAEGNLYVCEFMIGGRITKLRRLS